MSTQCNEFEASGIIARYVAGNLDDAAAQQFEDHYLTCARCQASVRAGSVARESDVARAPATRGRRIMLGAAITLAAASFAGVTLWRGGDGALLRELGRVDIAPLYLGAPVRAAESAGVIVFDSAMALYSERRYADAAEVLEGAVGNASDEPALSFFLGISHLMAGSTERAETALTRAIAAGESVYLTEALLYRAKTQLQRGDRAAAARDLRLAAQRTGDAAAEAQRILERLEQ